MSDPDHFLSRWSRRKREAADEIKERPAQEGAPDSPDARTPDRAAGSDVQPGHGAEAADPLPDLTALPSIESITAETDIRVFFAPGVPPELTRAALRRAWVADPKIRDFVGLADYDWDFNTPGAIEGFGPLEMTDELRREVARIVGNLLPDQEPELRPEPDVLAVTPQPAAATKEISAVPAPAEELPACATSSGSIDGEVPPVEPHQDSVQVRRNKEFVALQQTIEQPENLQGPARRGHGSALPK